MTRDIASGDYTAEIAPRSDKDELDATLLAISDIGYRIVEGG